MTLLSVLTHLDIGLRPGTSVLEDHLGTDICAQNKGMTNHHIDAAGQVFIFEDGIRQRLQTRFGFPRFWRNVHGCV